MNKLKSIEIPLKECKGFNAKSVWNTNKNYCPDYTDQTKLYGGYYDKKYSYLRLSVLRCNPVIRHCKSSEEQD